MGRVSKQVHAVKIVEGEREFHAARKLPMFPHEGANRSELARHQRTWRTFKKLGLPVPEFSAVYSRRPKSKKEGRKYLSTFMENMTKKHGPLKETHQLGDPLELNTLTVKKDSKLIKNLAKDLATIHNTNYLTDHLDFWHFYKKKDGTRGRVILDFNGFYIMDIKEEQHINHATNLVLVRKNLGPQEWNIFMKEYLTHYKLNP